MLPSGIKDSALVEGLYTSQQVLIDNFDKSECKDDATFQHGTRNFSQQGSFCGIWAH